MTEFLDIHASKIRFVIGSIIICASLLLLFLMISTFQSDKVLFAIEENPEGNSQDLASNGYVGTNVVASGLGQMVDATARTVSGVERTAVSSLKTVGSGTVVAGKTTARSFAFSARYVSERTYKSAAFIATGIGDSVVFTAQAPFKLVGVMASTLSSQSIARPVEQSSVPVIDSQLAELYASYPKTPIEEIANQTPEADPGALWPINGRVTTEFGVPHRPYQDTHTGIDISSGSYSGRTAVTPFKQGVVLSAVTSRYGLGNHVVVDHGNGLTSVYAHLYSISVQVGQAVGTSTVLGLEGSTGVSTGTHLHFEIRVNGQAVDPRQYITGLP